MTENQSINNTRMEDNEFVITREFNYPRDLVFKAWSDAEHLQNWWGPIGFKLSVTEFDFSPGGVFHFSMKSADGHEMWAKFVYQEIVSPEKIVYVSSFSDPEGNVVQAEFSNSFPLEVHYHLSFTEVDGKTILTLRGGPLHATEEEHSFFNGMFDSMKQGFGATFDQLVQYLA
jgi:uncharacterized protein YndB with AHSA1/START domain